MIAYWCMFVAALAGTLAPWRLRQRQADLMWLLVFVAFTLMIGWRHQVGGDWFNYENHFYSVQAMDLRGAILYTKDPAYYALSWLIARLGGDVYMLNLACAGVLVAGTATLSRQQPFPWLALLAAVPYLLIVVGMGYTRQAAAIGLVMLGLVALGHGGTRRFVVLALIAAAFHKSAVLILPLAALASSTNRFWTWAWVGVTALLAAWLFAYDSSDVLWTNYVESDYADASQGGPIRVAMNAVPAVFLICLRERLVPEVTARRLWMWIAIAALACIPLLQVSVTAVDRIALYFIPLQLVVAARLPTVARTVRTRTLLVLGVVGYYAAVQFVWLNFASHAHAWVPYRFMPL